MSATEQQRLQSLRATYQEVKSSEKRECWPFCASHALAFAGVAVAGLALKHYLSRGKSPSDCGGCCGKRKKKAKNESDATRAAACTSSGQSHIPPQSNPTYADPPSSSQPPSRVTSFKLALIDEHGPTECPSSPGPIRPQSSRNPELAKAESSKPADTVDPTPRTRGRQAFKIGLTDDAQRSAQRRVPTVVVGPSGVGKGTLLKKLKAEYENTFAVAVSHTTRHMRPGEVDGVHYHFVTREKFAQLVKANKFIEHAEYGKNLYGTSVQAVRKVAEDNKICLLEIDLQGALSVKKLGLGAKFLFITTSGDTLETVRQRLTGRGTEKPEQIQRRLSAAKTEIDFVAKEPKFFDMVLHNDDLDTAAAQLSERVQQWYPSLAHKKKSCHVAKEA